MKTSRSARILWFIWVLVAAACQGQNKPDTSFTSKEVIVARGETVKIPEIKMTITNHGCGRKWVNDGENPSYERPFCELEVRVGDSSYSAGQDFQPRQMGNIEFKVQRMNPWGRVEDSVPAGGCLIWVRKLSATPAKEP